MELTSDMLEKKTLLLQKLKGRVASTRMVYSNPKIASGVQVYIKGLYKENTLLVQNTVDGRDYVLYPDEINLLDKEYSDGKILKKGIRVERKDKYGDLFAIELISNKRDIYLSSALISLLNLNDETNYVGFAEDSDTGIMYIFKADEFSGYELNKKNNRITSVADWRELSLKYGEESIVVKPLPITDIDNPGIILFTIQPFKNIYADAVIKARSVKSAYDNRLEEAEQLVPKFKGIRPPKIKQEVGFEYYDAETSGIKETGVFIGNGTSTVSKATNSWIEVNLGPPPTEK